ncbi:ParB N-terminal domain-containing protein [Ligilactobacillus saerimneri]|uniref:ParB N-terminal domain-containing protein n=1 Tax=Ligilactobacillus saerimneri TaxID=228229 RepID=UPI0024B908DC|nr:ParB N-terminal domain-containing protein [Ligilactobacillus saerimneri]
MKVIEMDISEVKPYENNPRINEGGVEATANSIKEFGWQQPLVVDRDHVIIVGHTRLKAAEKLGLKKVPVVVADGLSEEQVKAYRLADNKTGELSDWNTKLLDDELQSLVDMDMSDFGFDEDIEFEPADSVSVKIDEPVESLDQTEVTCPHCGETFKID